MLNPRRHKALFVHGWATDSFVWAGLKGQLSCDGVDANLPSHGGVLNWDEPNISPAVREIGLAASDKGGVIGIGWSLGAMALLSAAIEKRSGLSALALVGATPCFVERAGFPHGQPRSLVIKMMAEMRKDPAAALKRFYPLNFTAAEASSGEAREFCDHYGSQKPAFDYDGISSALAALYNFDIREGLSSIDMPVLLLHGSADAVTPVKAARFLADNIKGAELDVFDGAGHAPFITSRERIASVVNGFLERV